MTPRPDVVKDAYLFYLDALRESGRINMFSAASYLQGHFRLDRYDAKEVLMYWMASFDERHPVGEGA